MPFTQKQFQDACSHLTRTGTLSGIGALYIDANRQVVLDEGNSNANITPDEATLTQALTDLAADQADEQATVNATNTIKQLQSIAASNSAFIASLMTWCLNADLASEDTATRFTGLVATFTGQSAGVLTVFKVGVIAETGVDIDAMGVGNLSDAEKKAILRFARGFATSWAVVLIS